MGSAAARSPPGSCAGIGAGGGLVEAAPRGRHPLTRVHRLGDLVDDQVSELGALFAVEILVIG